MIVHFDPRAEVAFRSLDIAAQNDVRDTVETLAPATSENWLEMFHPHSLQVMGGETLYSLRAGSKLRLLSKVIADRLVAQDIFSRERLEKILGKALP